jgi:hypothetical protein
MNYRDQFVVDSVSSIRVNNSITMVDVPMILDFCVCVVL